MRTEEDEERVERLQAPPALFGLIFATPPYCTLLQGFTTQQKMRVYTYIQVTTQTLINVLCLAGSS